MCVGVAVEEVSTAIVLEIAVPTNVKEFNADVQRIAKEMTGPILIEFQRRISLDAFARIINKTPVGDPSFWISDPPPGYVGGHARGNWQLTVGMAEQGEIDGVAVLPADQLGAAAARLQAMEAYAVVYITNNVAYISYLNDGTASPRQAPQGMVEVSLEEVRQIWARVQ